MTYNNFKAIIDHVIAHQQALDKAYAIKIDLTEAFDHQSKALDLMWKEILTPEGVDWLDWYLYEKDGISGKPRKDMQAWDHDKTEICKNVRDLWKYLAESNYFIV